LKKKVLFLPAWYPSRGSALEGIFVQEQARALTQDYDVAILAPKLVSWRDLSRGRIGAEPFREIRSGLAVYRERAWSPVPLVHRLGFRNYARAAERGFGKVLSEWGRPDLIHAHVVLPAGWAAASLGRNHGIPVILTEHSGPFSMHLRTSAQRRRVRETLTQVARVIAVSPALEKELRDFDPAAQIRVIGNLVDTQFFVPPERAQKAAPGQRTRFLSIALLHPGKGLHVLLEASRLLMEQGVDSFEVMIGGDGPERPRLERMARKAGLTGRCRFLGMLTPEEVRSWMQSCDAFVLPSLSETFGVVLAEAMACGKPVLSTHSGGPDFVVTPEAGMLVEPSDPVRLAEAMEGFITKMWTFDPAVIRRSVTERFGADAFRSNIAQVYEDIWTKS
jgi:glycosyltransferase involved in cell wall biosynthesis